MKPTVAIKMSSMTDGCSYLDSTYFFVVVEKSII
jgi:hypothetical protein